MTPPLLAVRRLRVQLPLPRRLFRPAGRIAAVDGIDFNLAAGEILGIVGESGSGKSTLARALCGLQAVAAGAIEYRGRNLATLGRSQWRPLRRDIQPVLQDPLASLDPRTTVARAVEEPLRTLFPELSAATRAERVRAALERFGLPAELADRDPHALSREQCERLGLARALIVEPKLLVCDDAFSTLELSLQAQLVDLLREIQQRTGLAMVFIARDPAMVRDLSQRVLVLYRGKVMEQGTREQVFGAPLHPYTRALLGAAPAVEAAPEAAPAGERGSLLRRAAPGASSLPAGCVFVTRCPMADERCTRQAPYLRRVGHGGYAACHYMADAARDGRSHIKHAGA